MEREYKHLNSIVKRINVVSKDINNLEEKLNMLNEFDIANVDSITIQYVFPLDRERHSIDSYYKNVVFHTPKGRDAQEFIDLMKCMIEKQIKDGYKALDKQYEELKTPH